MSTNGKVITKIVNAPTPDMQGPFGRAYNRMRPIDPAEPAVWTATIASWVVVSPCFHPAWDVWTVNAVHLRPIEGSEPPVLHFEGAQHEVVIASIDPTVLLDLGDPKSKMRYMRPLDLVMQLPFLTDDEVVAMVRKMVELMVENGFSPDSDNRRLWIELIGRTVSHRVEGHPDEQIGHA